MKATILVGDVRTRLKEIPDQSVQCCVTSPPYWGLRDYGHDGQIGLEQTPVEYVAEMVAVFDEVRRVLKDDGVLWLNLGDSYSGSGKGAYGDGIVRLSDKSTKQATSQGTTNGVFLKQDAGLKPKDLVGIPWRVAFALQEAGWYLRQDIIWHKPNPMPESVTDRCTKAHEYLFMLTKLARYYFDNNAIAEEANCAGERTWGANGKRNKRSVWSIPTKSFRGAHFAVMPEALCEPPILASSQPDDLILDPFTGSGTVAVVALRHNRNFIGTELNPEYANIANNRIQTAAPMFNEVEIK